VQENIQPSLESTRAGSQPAAGVFGQLLKGYLVKRRLPLVIFAVAFLARWFYNAVLLEHRVCEFGAAGEYLTAGSQLLQALASPQAIGQILDSLVKGHLNANLVSTAGSRPLLDHLLSGGPVYPAYLAFLLWLLRAPAAPDLGPHCLQLSLINSLFDALTCVLIYYAGRLAFDRRVDMLAASIFAFYPPAVINTAICCREPFTYFLLSIWTCLVFLTLSRQLQTTRWLIVTALLLGLCSGVLMLLSPLSATIPPTVALLLIALSAWRQRGGRRAVLASPAAQAATERLPERESAALPEAGVGVGKPSSAALRISKESAAEPQRPPTAVVEVAGKPSPAEAEPESPATAGAESQADSTKEGPSLEPGREAEPGATSGRAGVESAPEGQEQASEERPAEEQISAQEPAGQDTGTEPPSQGGETTGQAVTGSELSEKDSAEPPPDSLPPASPAADEQTLATTGDGTRSVETAALAADSAAGELRPEDTFDATPPGTGQSQPIIERQAAAPADSAQPPLKTAELLPAIESRDALASREARPLAPVARRKGKAALRLICVIAGLLGVLGPWLGFSYAATGKAVLFPDRAAARNLYDANDLAGDGWPLEPSPSPQELTIRQALTMIASSAVGHPLPFISLQLRKVPRLWAGVWNDFQYSLIGADLGWQQLLHQILLFAGLCGIFMLLSGPRHWQYSHPLTCGLVLFTVVLCHFSLIAFSPISRGNITAMPAIVLLASYALMRVFAAGEDVFWRFLKTLGLVVILLLLLQRGAGLIPIIAGMVPATMMKLVPWLDALFWAGAIVWVGMVALNTLSSLPMLANPRLCSHLVKSAFACAIVIAVAYSLTDPDRFQWWAELKTGRQMVRQDIYIPPMTGATALSPATFVLLDIDTPALLPRLKVTFNNVPLREPPMPWLQVQGDNESVLNMLTGQARAMGRELRSFRQWWAIAVPVWALRPGAVNAVTVRADRTSWLSSYRVYGDYGPALPGASDAVKILPSLEHLSYQKGFATFDHTDPRIYEMVRVLGRTTGSYWNDGRKWFSNDLSDERGCQRGEYRIRIAVPLRKMAAVPAAGTGRPAGPLVEALSGLAQAASPVDGGERREAAPPPRNAAVPAAALEPVAFPVIMLDEGDARGISAQDASSMQITSSPLRVPAGLPTGTRFYFSCDIRDLEYSGTAHVSVTFAGTDNGRPVSWRSAWEPACINLGQSWRTVSYCDTIPDNILRLKDLQVSVVILPFDPDLPAVKPDKALEQSVAVKDVGLHLMQPLGIPAPDQCEWLLY